MKNVIEMPKVVSVEIKKVGFFWHIFLRGVMLNREFLTKKKAEEYIPAIHGYFGDDCQFFMKEAA